MYWYIRFWLISLLIGTQSMNLSVASTTLIIKFIYLQPRICSLIIIHGCCASNRNVYSLQNYLWHTINRAIRCVNGEVSTFSKTIILHNSLEYALPNSKIVHPWIVCLVTIDQLANYGLGGLYAVSRECQLMSSAIVAHTCSQSSAIVALSQSSTIVALSQSSVILALSQSSTIVALSQSSVIVAPSQSSAIVAYSQSSWSKTKALDQAVINGT